MGNTQIIFTKSTREEIPAMAAIEQEFFGDYAKHFDTEFLEKWYAHNPDMFYLIKDADNTVLGFVILTPVSENLHYQLISGKIFDFFDFSPNDVPRTFASDYFYVSDICLTKKRKLSSIKASISIIGGMMKVLAENAKYITACPVTTAGANLCKTIGMQTVATSNFEGKQYTVCELKVTPDKINRFLRIMDRTNTK